MILQRHFCLQACLGQPIISGINVINFEIENYSRTTKHRHILLGLQELNRWATYSNAVIDIPATIKSSFCRKILLTELTTCFYIICAETSL